MIFIAVVSLWLEGIGHKLQVTKAAKAGLLHVAKRAVFLLALRTPTFNQNIAKIANTA